MNLSIAEASTILKLSRQRIHYLIRKKQLKARKIVGRYVISQKELTKWQNRNSSQ